MSAPYARSTFVRRFTLALTTAALVALGLPGTVAAATLTFEYTGAAQTWTVPAGANEVTFDLYGAQGAGAGGVFAGGLGGRATAIIPVTPGDVIQVTVGGWGSDGGFNGGGNARLFHGGGASDIRIGGTALADRVVVAGGGGGGGQQSDGGVSAAGGGGGGLEGLPGGSSGAPGGVGGGAERRLPAGPPLGLPRPVTSASAAAATSRTRSLVVAVVAAAGTAAAAATSAAAVVAQATARRAPSSRPAFARVTVSSPSRSKRRRLPIWPARSNRSTSGTGSRRAC